MNSPLADRGVRTASWLIRAAILAHLLGVAALIFNRGGTAIGSVALMEWDTQDPTIFFCERAAITILLAIGATLLVYPTAPAAAIVGIAVLAEVTASYRAGGYNFSSMAHVSQAMRYLAPFALIPLGAMPRRWPDAAWRYQACAWIMRVGIALVFIAHGIQALEKNPHFIDLIIGSTNRWLGHRPTEAQAVAILIPIGIMDVVVGALLLVGRWRPMLYEMALWGLITALSRITATGPLSYPEVLLRASHFLIPLAIVQLGPVLDAVRNRVPADTVLPSSLAPLPLPEGGPTGQELVK